MGNHRALRAVLTIAAALWLLLTSCREVNDTVYSRYADIPSDGWAPQEAVCFEVFPADSSLSGHNMRLELLVRYRASEPVGEIPLEVNVEDESGELLADTLKLRLFDASGNAADPQVFGIAEHAVTLIANFPLRRNLSVRTSPLTGPEETRGLLNIGTKLSKSSNHGSDTTTR